MHPATFFQHCPRCGFRAAETRSAGPFHCDNCDFQYYFNPAIAAAAFVLREDGAALFIRRSKEPAKGKLALPGGFIDAGETAEDAVRREVREEVDLELDELRYFTSHPNQYSYRGVVYPVLDLFFVARTKHPHRAQALDGVEGFEWIQPADVDLGEIAFPSIQKALELMRAAG